MKSHTKTFAIHLNKQEACILSITTTGKVHDVEPRDIVVLDSKGLLIANVRLAMDASKRELQESNTR